jgi:lipopolysaccharide/colanic/teichoic acid biosynthesis glycosyltransferase
MEHCSGSSRQQIIFGNHKVMASILTRVLDIAVSALGLLVLLPVLAILTIAIMIENPGPALFRQVRIGRKGRPFRICKLRSMRTDGSGTRITAARDSRITRVGRFLRTYKLDELPQLWNVLRGDMSLVGPRPEVPAFVDLRDPLWREVLEVRPGITDLASLVYRSEETLLAQAADPEEHYRRVLLPSKLSLSVRYLRRRSWLTDLKVLALTVTTVAFPEAFEPTRIERVVISQ